MSNHQHVAEHRVWLERSQCMLEVCECGGTRYVNRGVAQAWHTCTACTHPWGLHKLVPTGAAQRDRLVAARLDLRSDR